MGYCGMSYTHGGVPYELDGTPQASKYDANYQQTWRIRTLPVAWSASTATPVKICTAPVHSI